MIAHPCPSQPCGAALTQRRGLLVRAAALLAGAVAGMQRALTELRDRRRVDEDPALVTQRLVDAGLIKHHHVVGTLGDEQRTGVHRRSVQWIVVAGEQVHRNSDGAHGFQGLTDHLRRELVVFEDVA